MGRSVKISALSNIGSNIRSSMGRSIGSSIVSNIGSSVMGSMWTGE